jgi:hypothetical protein
LNGEHIASRWFNSAEWVSTDPVTSDTSINRPYEQSSHTSYFDPVGAYIPAPPLEPTNEIPPPPSDIGYGTLRSSFGDISESGTGCMADGLPVPCSRVTFLINSGGGVYSPPEADRNGNYVQNGQIYRFHAYADGSSFDRISKSGNHGTIVSSMIEGDESSYSVAVRPDRLLPNSFSSLIEPLAIKEIASLTLPASGNNNYQPWVVKNIGALEKRVAEGFDGFENENGTTFCARLPQDWDFKIQGQPMYPRNTTQWQMGAALTPYMNIERGTVVATFNRSIGRYKNNNSGNHTAIFLEWGGRTVGFWRKSVEQGMWILEQGPSFAPRKRFVPFNKGAGYFNDAGEYNVVNICPSLSPPKSKKR